MESVIWGFTGISIWPVLGLVLLGAVFLLLLVAQLSNIPGAIIGIRPHELGPLIYDEEELITSVRFILICYPYTVHLQNCELIYEEGEPRQVGRLNQIQPTYSQPGELTYGIAQIVGNHTKAKGANLFFTYKEKEDTDDTVFQIPVQWA